MTARNTLSAEMIESRCEKVPFSGCWIWMGSAGKKFGYGTLSVDGRHMKAHRASWEAFHGYAGKLHVLHSCDVTACVNPDHLFLGTHQDNVDDRERKGRNKAPPAASKIPDHFDKRFRKLSDEAVREIISLKPTKGCGGKLVVELSEKFGVKVRAIYKVWEGINWGHAWQS